MPIIGPRKRDPRTWACYLCRSVQQWQGRSRLDSEELALEDRTLSVTDQVDSVFLLQPPRSIREFFTLEQKLGQGGFGTVFRAQATELGLKTDPHLKPDKTYAIKMVPRRKEGLEQVCRSLMAISPKRHIEFVKAWKAGADMDNFVQIVSVFMEYQTACFMVMELLKGPDLFDFLHGRSAAIPERDAADLTRQVLVAIHYLHRTIGALHRDVKPENFGFDTPLEEGAPLPNLKLFDIGLAVVLPEVVTDATATRMRKVRRAGTWLYMSPETWDGFTGPPSDVWAAGFVAYLLLSLQVPFGLLSPKGRADPARAVREAPLTFHGPVWKAISNGPQALVSAMMCKESSQRITTSAALDDPWLASRRPKACSFATSETTMSDIPLELPEKFSTVLDDQPWKYMLCSSGSSDASTA